jgi:4-hydroxy-3-methylbut-2-en-1-yl diphosphate reductase
MHRHFFVATGAVRDRDGTIKNPSPAHKPARLPCRSPRPLALAPPSKVALDPSIRIDHPWCPQSGQDRTERHSILRHGFCTVSIAFASVEDNPVTLPPLMVLLAAPRGFCAGVDRAIQIVEVALQKFGPPVYVRHEIVHNRFVVQSLEAKGAIFVKELDQVPDDRPVVFSAHGVPKSVPAQAQRRNMIYVDATCPLVSKVHREAERHYAEGRSIILIGHAGHPEVIGTIGQLPVGAVQLAETAQDAEKLIVTDPDRLAFVTQTTLSVDDTATIVAILRRRFPSIAGPKREDICYATTNRQAAVKAIAPRVDALLALGAPNSSNSVRLVEVARAHGAPKAILVGRASEIDWRDLHGVTRLGITAGASAPEILVEEVLEALRLRFTVTIEEVQTATESVVFNLPRILTVVP